MARAGLTVLNAPPRISVASALPQGPDTQEQDDERGRDERDSVAPAAPSPSEVHVDRLLRPGQGEQDDESDHRVGERCKRLCEEGQHVGDEVAGQLDDEDGDVARESKCQSAACASNLLHHVQPKRRAGHWKTTSGTRLALLRRTVVSSLASTGPVSTHGATVRRYCKSEGGNPRFLAAWQTRCPRMQRVSEPEPPRTSVQSEGALPRAFLSNAPEPFSVRRGVLLRGGSVPKCHAGDMNCIQRYTENNAGWR